MTEEATIDIYECFFYRGIGVKFCKYYPKGCYCCGELIKTGEKKNDRNKLSRIIKVVSSYGKGGVTSVTSK